MRLREPIPTLNTVLSGQQAALEAQNHRKYRAWPQTTVNTVLSGQQAALEAQNHSKYRASWPTIGAANPNPL